MIEDHGEIRLETTEGWRPDPPRGERILVVLAGVALLGAALIVGGNLLARHDEVSTASASPQASAQPSPSTFVFTPFPTPSPQEIALQQRTPLPVESQPALFSGWIRPLVDLPIHESADDSSAVVGTLRAGEAAYVDEQGEGAPERGWAVVEGSDTARWVATRDPGKDLVERYAQTDQPVTGWFGGIVAGQHGFVAVGTPSGRSSAYPGTLLYFSADGVTWHRASGFTSRDGYYGVSVAWGPAGWLAIGVDDDGRGEVARIWTSDDGERWTSPGVIASGDPYSLVGSAAGYLVRGGGGRGLGSGDDRLWFSADGIHWTESRPALGGTGYGVMATAAGFYASTTLGCCALPSQESAAFSSDGLTWTPTMANLLVAAVDGAMIGIEPGQEGRGGRAYRGAFYRGRLGWRAIKGGDQPFTGAVVTSVASDGHRAIAFGWDPATESAVSWTSDGGQWTRHALPADLGGAPQFPAVNGDAAVTVGDRVNSRGPNPVIWHDAGDGTWEPERMPVLGIAPDPTAADCAAPPHDPVLFVNLDRAVAAACYGDAPLTIRVWSSRCDGCAGGDNGTFDEAWLANPTQNALWLSPAAVNGYWAMGVLAPGLRSEPDPSWIDSWLEVTGHFDDPASPRCHRTAPRDEVYYGASPSWPDVCRQQFVVTGVEVVGGP